MISSCYFFKSMRLNFSPSMHDFCTPNLMLPAWKSAGFLIGVMMLLITMAGWHNETRSLGAPPSDSKHEM